MQTVNSHQSDCDFSANSANEPDKETAISSPLPLMSSLNAMHQVMCVITQISNVVLDMQKHAHMPTTQFPPMERSIYDHIRNITKKFQEKLFSKQNDIRVVYDCLKEHLQTKSLKDDTNISDEKGIHNFTTLNTSTDKQENFLITTMMNQCKQMKIYIELIRNCQTTINDAINNYKQTSTQCRTADVENWVLEKMIHAKITFECIESDIFDFQTYVLLLNKSFLSLTRDDIQTLTQMQDDDGTTQSTSSSQPQLPQSMTTDEQLFEQCPLIPPLPPRSLRGNIQTSTHIQDDGTAKSTSSSRLFEKSLPPPPIPQRCTSIHIHDDDVTAQSASSSKPKLPLRMPQSKSNMTTSDEELFRQRPPIPQRTQRMDDDATAQSTSPSPLELPQRKKQGAPVTRTTWTQNGTDV